MIGSGINRYVFERISIQKGDLELNFVFEEMKVYFQSNQKILQVKEKWSLLFS